MLSTWTAAIPRRSGVEYADLALTDDGGFVIGGSSYNGREERDGWIGRFDTLGALLWDGAFTGEGEGSDRGTGVTVDDAGRAYLAGWFENSIGVSSSFAQGWSAEGEELWWLRGTGRSGERRIGHDIAFDPMTGGVLVAGSDDSDSYLGLVGGVERAGRWLDVETYDYRGGRAEASGVATNVDGSVVAISGWVSNDGTGFDVLAATFTRDDEGTISRGWFTSVDGGTSGEDRGEDVAVDSMGHVIVVGRVTGDGRDDDLFVGKFVP